jgi:cholesterol transport system auxiliary component
MRPTLSAARVLLAGLVLPLALGGCVSLFPKTKPVQLYRFGGQTAPVGAPSAAAPPLVIKGATDFPPSASGDRILTVTGNEEAFIAGARWAAPAAVIFDQDLLRAFDVPGAPRLVERGEPINAPSSLRLDVRDFEVRYPGPVAVVHVRATLIRSADRTIIAERAFDADTPAGDNRQGPIVAAFSTGVDKVLTDIRAWTAANAPGR